MTKINPESEFRFEFRTYCEGVARHHAEDDIQELLSLEADRPERCAKALRKFYKKEADKILEAERYRQAKQQVSALPFDLAFGAIETPATVAAYESNPVYMEAAARLTKELVSKGFEINPFMEAANSFVSNPNPLFWKLIELPIFSDFIYLERKQYVLTWIGERLKALKESDRPGGAIPADDKAGPATGEHESQPAAKVSNEDKDKKELQTLEKLLPSGDIDATLRVMRKLELTNDLNQWKHGTRKGPIMAVVHVLIDRGKVKESDKVLAAKLLAKKIGTTISERTTRNTSHHMEDMKAELKALIK